MKRTLLLMTALLAVALNTQAQRTVSGRVVDGEQKEGVIQATVAMLTRDSALVANAKTDMDGRFSMTAPKDGAYVVRVSYVGYKTLTRDIRVNGRPLDMGTLTINMDAIMLKGAEVVRNVAKVTTRDDTIMYNASAYRTPEGSVVEELVKKLPGAEVSDDGTIKINGKEVKKILVDGKEFMTGDTQTAIKNLPSSIVERIKAYDEKSDLSRVTGIDDGNDQTVLDFGLKRGMNRGTFANVDVGAGTKQRYAGRLMGAMMKDDWRVMAMTNANNVNDMGFGGGGGGGRFGGGGRNGLQAAKMGAVNFNYEKKDRLKWNGSLRWNHRDGDAWSRRSTENFVARTGSFAEAVNQGYTRSNAWNAQMLLEWQPDTMTNVNFRPSWSYGTNDARSQSSSATFSADPYDYVAATDNIALMVARMLGISDTLVVNSRSNADMSYSDSKRFGGTLQLNRKLGSRGRNVTLRTGANYSKGNAQAFSHSLVELYQLATGDSAYQKNRYSVTPQKAYDYSVEATYSEPIGRATFLQFSYQFEYRYTKNDRATYDFWKQDGDPDMSGLWPGYRQWESVFGALGGRSYQSYLDEELSRFSQYKNYVHKGEVMLRVVRPAYNFNVGVQLLPQTSEFTYRYLKTDTVTTRAVVNWSPTANFRWKLSDRGQMRFQYRGTTSQPSMTDLLPITDDSDPLNVTMGNPALKPSFTQHFNWRYNDYFERHQRFVFARLSFSTTRNAVANRVVYDPVTGGRTSKPENINGNWNVGGNFTFNTALDTLGRYNVNTATDLNYENYAGYIDIMRDGHVSKMSTRQTTVGQRLGTSYRNDWLEVELNGRVQYNYVYNRLQPQSNLSTWAFSYGFNATLVAPWGMQFTTALNMSSRRGYSDAAANTNELIWNAQIAQGFLKGKPLTVRLEFYDILHQQSSFSRAISALARTDNRYNAINSYVMLRLNYRLNLFGTKEMRKGMHMGPGDPDGRPDGRPDGGRPRGDRPGGFGPRGGFGGPGGRF